MSRALCSMDLMPVKSCQQNVPAPLHQAVDPHKHVSRNKVWDMTCHKVNDTMTLGSKLNDWIYNQIANGECWQHDWVAALWLWHVTYPHLIPWWINLAGWNRVLGLKFHDAWRKPSVLDSCCLVFCSFKSHIAVCRHDWNSSFHLLCGVLSVTNCCHCTFTNCRSCSFACWCWSARNCRVLILPVPQLVSFLLVLLNLSLRGGLFLEAGFMGHCPVAVVSGDLLIF